jgi:hypothetical protein
MTSVEGAVRHSVEKLNVEHLGSVVSGAVREWLVAELAEVKDLQSETTDALSELEEHLKGVMQRGVIEPQERRHEHVTSLLAGLPSQVAVMSISATKDLCESQFNAGAANVRDKLAEMRVRLDEGLAKQSREVLETKTGMAQVSVKVQRVLDDVGRMWVDTKERSADQKVTFAGQLSGVQGVVKGVISETIKSLELKSSNLKTLVYGTQQQLVKLERDVCDSMGMLQVLRKSTDDLTGKLDAVGQQLTVSQTKQQNSLRIKGQVGESTIYDMLSERLTHRENYEIEIVNGMAHNCDMNIRRTGYPDVRLESKAIGQGTGEKVRQRDVARFQSDLVGMNSSGIMVSIHSGIVGKGLVDIEVLPNGKFAAYLSHNKYDVDAIEDMVRLIYRLEKLMADRTGGDAEVRISSEDIKQLKLYLRDFATKLHSTRTHLKEALALLNEVAFDVVERILSGRGAACDEAKVAKATAARVVPAPVAAAAIPSPPQPKMLAPAAHVTSPTPSTNPKVLMCLACNRTFFTRTALAGHNSIKHPELSSYPILHND